MTKEHFKKYAVEGAFVNTGGYGSDVVRFMEDLGFTSVSFVSGPSFDYACAKEDGLTYGLCHNGYCRTF